MDDSCHLVFATPYYGNVANPKYGVEFVYTIGSACRKTGAIVTTKVAVWCGQGHVNLCQWLVQNKVEVFLARDCCFTLERFFNHTNIEPYWDIKGDIHESIETHLNILCPKSE